MQDCDCLDGAGCRSGVCRRFPECPVHSAGRNVKDGCQCDPGHIGTVAYIMTPPYYSGSCDWVPQPLYISEIGVGGGTSGWSGEQYVEIYNPSCSAVDLGIYAFAVGQSSAATARLFKFPRNARIMPKGTYVVCRDDYSQESVAACARRLDVLVCTSQPQKSCQ